METESGQNKRSAACTFLQCFELVKFSSGNVRLGLLMNENSIMTSQWKFLMTPLIPV